MPFSFTAADTDTFHVARASRFFCFRPRYAWTPACTTASDARLIRFFRPHLYPFVLLRRFFLRLTWLVPRLTLIGLGVRSYWINCFFKAFRHVDVTAFSSFYGSRFTCIEMILSAFSPEDFFLTFFCTWFLDAFCRRFVRLNLWHIIFSFQLSYLIYCLLLKFFRLDRRLHWCYWWIARFSRAPFLWIGFHGRAG